MHVHGYMRVIFIKQINRLHSAHSCQSLHNYIEETSELAHSSHSHLHTCTQIYKPEHMCSFERPRRLLRTPGTHSGD